MAKRKQATWADEETVLVQHLRSEIARLQRIIDSRPAINAGLPESYIRWSQSIYELEFSRATSSAS